MSNTIRTVGFVISLMGSITIMMIITPFISDATLISYGYFYFFLYLIFFVLIQSSFRLFTSRAMTKKEALFVCKPFLNILMNRLYYYSFLFLLFILPVIRGLSLSDISIEWMIQLLLGIIIIEVFIHLTNKTLLVFILKEGILVKGIDLRIDIPIGAPIQTHSGFYPYEYFSSFHFDGAKFNLTLYHQRGTLSFHTSTDLEKPLAGLLQSKGIAQ